MNLIQLWSFKISEQFLNGSVFKGDFMIDCLLVGAGGAAGAIFRYLIGLLPLSPKNGFPLRTFLINVIGCFAIGIVAALAQKNSLSPKLVLFLKVGVCGGFTTFSSFALENQNLLQKGSSLVAALYVVLSVLLGILAVFAAEKMIGKI